MGASHCDGAGFGSNRTFHRAHLLGLLDFRKLRPRRSLAVRSALKIGFHARSWMEIQLTPVFLIIDFHNDEGMGCISVRLLVLCDDAREPTGAQQLKEFVLAPLFCVHALRYYFRPQTSETRKHDRPICPTENSVAKGHRNDMCFDSPRRSPESADIRWISPMLVSQLTSFLRRALSALMTLR